MTALDVRLEAAGRTGTAGWGPGSLDDFFRERIRSSRERTSIPGHREMGPAQPWFCPLAQMPYPGIQAEPMAVRCPPVFDESSLVERLASAEPAAIGEVYDAHHRAIHAFAWRLLGDAMAAEDLVHDVFVALPKAVRRFRGDASLRTFLIGIAVNHARHHVRSATRRRAALERLGRENPEPLRTPEQGARQAELARALTRAMDDLSVEHRVTFVLAEVEDRSSREVAEILGIPDATVRTRLHHAKKKLRAALEGGDLR